MDCTPSSCAGVGHLNRVIFGSAPATAGRVAQRWRGAATAGDSRRLLDLQ